ncbi:MAG: twin-arginine translocation signal domain-containing protein, partial [Planctomycetota bacterium]
MKSQRTKKADILTRRHFLKNVATATSAALALPTIIPARVLSAEAP